MWSASRGDSRVWLFGHVTGLVDTAWLDDELRDLVGSCAEVWTEIAPGDAGDPLIAELGSGAERALSVLAGPHRWPRIRAVCDALGVDSGDLDGVRPWLAAQMIEAVWLESAGARAEAGADPVIAGLAHEGRAKLHHEMSFGAAIRLFGSLDDEAQLGYLDHVVELAAEGPDGPTARRAAWMQGDTSMAEVDERRLAGRAPAFHQRLVVARNRSWALEIDEMLERDGDRLVCLGVGQLVGPQGVPALLADRGVEAEPR